MVVVDLDVAQSVRSIALQWRATYAQLRSKFSTFADYVSKENWYLLISHSLSVFLDHLNNVVQRSDASEEKIIKKSDVKRIVTKTFIKNKSGGCRKIRVKAADGYSGLSKRNVLKITENDLKFKRFNSWFTNKAVHKPVHARKVP